MNTRYLFEHDLLPKLFSKDPVRVINKTLTEKTDYIFGMLKQVYDKKNEVCPYSLTDIDIEIKSEESFDFIIINMPKRGIDAGNCHQIIFAYSFMLDLFQYYTVEAGYNPKNGEFKSLAAWIEDSHVSFGDLADDDIIKRILTTLEV
jgi:hypothetical protein